MSELFFSTLWTQISAERSDSIRNGLNDYRIIGDGDSLFSVERCNELFEENLTISKRKLNIMMKNKI